MPLFEVAIIEQPSKKDRDEGKTEKLIMPPKHVMAKNAQAAAFVAAFEAKGSVPEFDTAKAEVLVRPFA